MRELSKYVALQVLLGYKRLISPMFPPACRYVPTCSEYAMEAIERYGVIRGAGMTCLRLLRCHPFAKGGYDPVVVHPPTAGHECQPVEREVQGQRASMLYRRFILRNH